MQWQIDIWGSWAAKADVMNFSLRTTFFGKRKHGQAPAEHFLSCVSFQHVHSVLLESIKAYSFNLNDSSFVGQFLSSFFPFFHNTVPSSFQSFFLFTWASVNNEDNDAQSESYLLILRNGFNVFKASRSSRKSNVFLGERVYLRVEGSSSEKDKRSQREGSDNVAFVLGATAAVLLRFGSPNKNITLRKKEE